jgi:predicted class III extradiol MEMO1 family dioxygenase
VRDVQAAIARATGQVVPAEQIRDFAVKLDRTFYLDTPGCARRRRELAHAYLTARSRRAHFAGQAYPADPDALARSLDAALEAASGPGRPAGPVARMPRAIVAPHIDPGRGAAAYAHAYATLWGARPERVVILGVLHGASANPFVLTGKDFATPLGTARADARRVQALVQRLDWDPLAEEELHRAEHSIEFQVLLLQHALAEGGARAVEPGPEVLPVLCGFGPADFGSPGASPERRARIDGFLRALRAAILEDPAPTLVVAGVDLAHVGPRFGDARPMSPAWADEIRRRDEATLEQLATGDAEGFVREVVEEQDNRRICGFGALYALLALIGPARGRVLDYGQSADPGGLVSFAALAFDASSEG